MFDTAPHDFRITWQIDSSSSKIFCFTARSQNLFEHNSGRIVVKLVKNRINFSEFLHCPIGRSWNEFMWLHTASLQGYDKILEPLYCSHRFGYIILPDFSHMDYKDLRSALLLREVSPKKVHLILNYYINMRRDINDNYKTNILFKEPKGIFYHFRFVSHFQALIYELREEKLSVRINELSEHLLFCNDVIIHGDFSPKNIILTNDSFFLIDAESAGFGDIDFDVLFFLSQMLIECGNSDDTKEWEHVAINVLGLHFAQSPPDLYRISRCTSMLAMMMLARLKGLARPQEYDSLEISDRVIEYLKGQLLSPIRIELFIKKYFEYR
jgi:hypothetical protein